ncbi:hypothetical protein QL285_051813 [Trifolium repens]|nr:hypothetical protein QL285_051813 [Trifolium repens]
MHVCGWRNKHGEDFRWWEYQIPENNNYLEIPGEFSFIFFNRNQCEIKVIDQENGERYACDIHFGINNMDGIYVGNGWSDYLKARDLKKGDWLFLSLFGDNPHNLHAVVIESE